LAVGPGLSPSVLHYRELHHRVSQRN
jgi:hypothetical protein